MLALALIGAAASRSAPVDGGVPDPPVAAPAPERPAEGGWEGLRDKPWAEGVSDDWLRVIWCESGGQSVPSPPNADGTRDYGLAQINEGWVLGFGRWDPYLPALGVASAVEDLLDPAVNLAAARAVFDYAGGWGPWSASMHCHGLGGGGG